MKTIGIGSRGREVSLLQLRLNIRLRPSPRLKPDGIFGRRTDVAVRRFQMELGLVVDGIVGPNTRKALSYPTATPVPPNLRKFVAQLGTVDDFVRHVQRLVMSRQTTSAVFAELTDFLTTDSGVRYLLVKRDPVGVIDFRHFFVAAAESHQSEASRRSTGGIPLGGSEGKTVLLGVANEIGQCVDEVLQGKINSCFAREDIGSNRLGAQFGELVKRKEAEARALKLDQLLKGFLTQLQPLKPRQVRQVKMSGRWDVFVESISAVMHGIHDVLIPSAY